MFICCPTVGGKNIKTDKDTECKLCCSDWKAGPKSHEPRCAGYVTEGEFTFKVDPPPQRREIIYRPLSITRKKTDMASQEEIEKCFDEL